MSFESLEQNPKIEIEAGFEGFVPEEFKEDPFVYFEERGINIKSGEVQRDESGKIKEDPTAVKDLPVWSDSVGNTLETVAKKINVEKSQVKKMADPFHEYRVMELAREFDLPAPKPIAKVEQNGVHLIVMEKIKGIRWTDRDAEYIRSIGYSEEDIATLRTQAEEMIIELSKQYADVGIIRTWKLKDMIFNIDIENKKLISVTPTDWERTKVDMTKVTEARQHRAS